MMSLGQKLIAITMILFLELLAFLLSPILGILGLFVVIPLAIMILKR